MEENPPKNPQERRSKIAVTLQNCKTASENAPESPRKALWPAPATSLLQQEADRQIINRYFHWNSFCPSLLLSMEENWTVQGCRGPLPPASKLLCVFSSTEQFKEFKNNPLLSHQFKGFSFSQKHFYQQQPIPETATFSISRDGTWQHQYCTAPC